MLRLNPDIVTSIVVKIFGGWGDKLECSGGKA